MVSGDGPVMLCRNALARHYRAWMSPVGLVLLFVGAIIAFWAGSRSRHNSRTWSDHKATRAAEQTLRKRRWATLGAALLAIFVLVLFLGMVTSRVAHEIPIRPTPSASCSAGPFGRPICPAPTKSR
jgi:ABC-type Fe3+ transport system permease subunit